MNQESSQESNAWTSWIIRSTKEVEVLDTNYDKLCELAVSTYALDSRSQKLGYLDLITFFCVWWDANKQSMKKYKSLNSVGELLGGRHHRTVLYHVNAFSDEFEGRLVTLKYDINTECIRDFLES